MPKVGKAPRCFVCHTQLKSLKNVRWQWTWLGKKPYCARHDQIGREYNGKDPRIGSPASKRTQKQFGGNW